MRKDNTRRNRHPAWKITRRTFLAGAAASASPAAAAGDFQVDLRNGGFTLYIDGHPVWQVTDQHLRAALGASCELSLVSSAGARIGLRIDNGRLLDESGYALELDLQRPVGTQCTISAVLTGPRTGPINFEPRPLPIRRSWEIASRLPPASATALLARLGGQQVLGGATQLALDERLRILLIATRAFRLAERLRASRLVLTPGATMRNGETRLATFLGVEGDGVLPLGVHDGPMALDQVSAHVDWPLSATSVHIDLLVGGQSILLVEGPGKLVLSRDANPQERIVVQGDERTRLRQVVGSGRQFDLQLPLPKRDFAVATPLGTLVVHGLDEAAAPVHLASKGGVISTFEASLPISNVGLRLDGADLGRLDFDSARCAIRFGNLGMVANSDGFIRLGPGRGPSLSLNLEKARLWCARQSDLLFFACRFRDIVLAVDGGEAKLGPKEPKSAGGKPDPLLVVELPSQHILERAFFRPLFTPPSWPGDNPAVSQLQNVGDRRKLREAAEGRSERFKQFATEYRRQWRSSREEIEARKIDASEPDNSPDSEWLGSPFVMSVRGRIVERITAETLNTAIDRRIRDIRLHLSVGQLRDIKERYPRPSVSPNEAVQDLLANAERSEPEHAVLQEAYRGWKQQAYRAWKGQEGGDDPRYWPDKAHPAWPERIYTREAVEAWSREAPRDGVVAVATAPASEMASWLSELAKALPTDPTGGRIKEIEAAFSSALRAAVREDISGALPIEARAAGPTRLAYGLKGKWPKPYALSTLLQWSVEGSPDCELRVVGRAERVDPNELDSRGIAKVLADRGIAAGTSIEARMRDVVKSAKSPTPEETAIELPARLLLSPDSKARFQERAEAATQPSLWRVRLREQQNRAYTLRAIDSPDFVADAFSEVRERPSGPKMLEPDESWVYPGQKFRTSLDPFDRHQLVGLSSLYGLPVIPRGRSGDLIDQSQITPPKEYALENLLRDDTERQAIYLPKALPVPNLSLSALGAWMDLDVGFIPPASVRDAGRRNLFDAFSIERWRNQVAWGRDTLVEVLYKGFLCPLGHRATLVKVTERRFLPPGKGHLRPVAYLVQRLFIQVGQPTKTYGAVAQPFEGRGWPARSITIVTTQTPDLVDPRAAGGGPSQGGEFSRTLNGALVRGGETGLVFWPQTAPGSDGTVQFRMRVDGSTDSVEMPLIFVDNRAAHDPKTMQALQRYYNDTLDAQGESRSRRLDHANARRRYAPERKAGDTTFETLSWLIRLDSRLPVIDTCQDRSTESPALVAMDGALEADDQPPFYPRLDFGVIRHDTVARFTGNAQAELSVTYSEGYLKDGFSIYDGSGVDGKVENARKDVVGDTYLRVVGGRPRYDLPRDPTAAKCWPAFDTAPNLTLGSNGDRAGGLARPEQAIPYLARFGPVGGTSGTDPPKPMGLKSFLPSAKLLGLVDISELVGAFGLGAASPILNDTLEFLCEGASTIAGNLKPHVDGLLGQFDKEDRLRSIYKGAYHALKDTSEAISKAEKLKTCSPEDAPVVTEMVASVRTLARELERLAAPPLAPITAVVRGELAAAENRLSDALKVLLAAPKLERAGEMLAAFEPFLQPVSLARGLLTLSPEQRKILEQPPLRAELKRALEQSLMATLGSASLDALPPDLAILRRSIAEQVRLKIKAVAEGASDATAKTAVEVLAGKMHDLILAAEPLPVIRNLYAMLVALRGGDWIASVAAYVQSVINDILLRLASWTAALCSDGVSVMRGMLRVALPDRFDASGCPIERECKSSAGPNICGALWKVYCALPVAADAARKATEALASNYAVLPDLLAQVAGFRDLADDPECALPTDDVVRDTQALLAGVDEFSKSLIAWLRAIAAVPDEAVLKSAAEAAKEGLRLLTPRTDEFDRIRTKLARVVGDGVARAVSEALEQAKSTLGDYERLLANARSAKDLSPSSRIRS